MTQLFMLYSYVCIIYETKKILKKIYVHAGANKRERRNERNNK